MLRLKVFSLSDKTLLARRIRAIDDKKCYIALLKLVIKENIKYEKR